MEFVYNYQRFADYQDKMLVVEISYYNVLFPIYQIIVPTSTFSGPDSERHPPTRRRHSGVALARLRVSSECHHYFLYGYVFDGPERVDEVPRCRRL